MLRKINLCSRRQAFCSRSSRLDWCRYHRPQVAHLGDCGADFVEKHVDQLLGAARRLAEVGHPDEFAIPRILVVVLIPENLADWLQQSEEELCLRYCGFWVSLRGMPETQNTGTVTVRLLRTNQFTPQALQSIMQVIGQGVKP